MKIYIGKYKSWFGPYQLAERILFFTKRKGEYPEYVHKFGEWLDTGKIRPKQKVGEIRDMFTKTKKTYLSRFLSYVDSKKKRKIKIRIDKYDTWNADDTLARIIHPLLVKYKEKLHGHPTQLTEESWGEILDKMIFAFYYCIEENEPDFSGQEKSNPKSKKLENGCYEIIFDGENIYDLEAEKAHYEKVQEGLDLFAKYFRNLWN